MNKWYLSKIIRGNRIGSAIGYPTLNLENASLLSAYLTGVYTCLIRVDKKIYKGVLFYGPRLVLGEKINIIEIFVFDLKGDYYGKTIEFTIGAFIRKPEKFESLNDLKLQLEKDCKKALDLLNHS
jgi:riboflavin kinase / FMN adenylyltransferase